MKTGNGSFSSSVENALSHLTENQLFAEIFHHGSLLLEIYAPHDVDHQQPHTRDEVYFVVSGTGEYVNGETRQPFKPTDVLFAAAGTKHRFENFSDDFKVWVLFYGPEGGESIG